MFPITRFYNALHIKLHTHYLLYSHRCSSEQPILDRKQLIWIFCGSGTDPTKQFNSEALSHRNIMASMCKWLFHLRRRHYFAGCITIISIDNHSCEPSGTKLWCRSKLPLQRLNFRTCPRFRSWHDLSISILPDFSMSPMTLWEPVRCLTQMSDRFICKKNIVRSFRLRAIPECSF